MPAGIEPGGAFRATPMSLWSVDPAVLLQASRIQRLRGTFQLVDPHRLPVLTLKWRSQFRR
jgi:hypothetical protein